MASSRKAPRHVPVDAPGCLAACPSVRINSCHCAWHCMLPRNVQRVPRPPTAAPHLQPAAAVAAGPPRWLRPAARGLGHPGLQQPCPSRARTSRKAAPATGCVPAAAALAGRGPCWVLHSAPESLALQTAASVPQKRGLVRALPGIQLSHQCVGKSHALHAYVGVAVAARCSVPRNA